MRIAIIGGGISGLTLAWHLQKAGLSYDLFDASADAGGNIRSEQAGSYLLETGPNSLQLSPELEELIADLRMTDQIEDTAAVSKNRYVLRGGQYRKLPGSPPALLASGFFSLKTKLHLLRELRRPAGPVNEQETLGNFFRRRFDQEIVDYALNPFISGIYAGDPDQLLVHKTFPSLPRLEQTYGSVLKGLAKSGGGAGRRRIISVKGGLQQLPRTLAARLTGYHGNQAVTGLVRQPDGRYSVQAPAAEEQLYDNVVLALPAYLAGQLLETLFPAEAAALSAVYYPPMTAIFTAYRRADVAHPLDGFGALHPKVENPYAAGSIWTSSIFPGRCPADQVLFTSFVGGVQYEAQARDPEETQKASVHAELSRRYGIRASEPLWQGRYYWDKAIPQFDHRIGAAHAAADALAGQGIYAAANWRAGVGVPDCVRHARQLAVELGSRPGQAKE
ncbi:protoporphyrinogen oxidase [Hymenobacter sp. BT175]|uniref:protoporphyrinogen oxidase n=1 Tax=Hymenobacter translucens TaxID=2886507 RepID=UPI001D0E2E7D|nr:protoporphyrinogen oxidase [Hymenobacter translucens]MCC2546789.1 protoporphyrinogen oxidase [Hymenobacter translucens]